MRQVLCVWFPNWPLQRLCHVRPELKSRSVVLYRETSGGGFQVTACSESAAAQGVQPGMLLAEAKERLQNSEVGKRKRKDSRLLTPDSSFFPHHPRADVALLQRVAASGRCFSPLVGIEEAAEPECVLLDLTGCAHLFGGEQAVAEQVVRAWQAQGFVVYAAVASTIGMAWGIARFGRIRNSEGLPSSEFSLLPLAALRLSPATIETLHELDIQRVEQLLALPRTSLAARFGVEVAQRIDQATGHCEELITSLRVPEPLEAVCTFEEPRSDRETLCAAIRSLLDEITRQLETRQQGVRGLLVRLGRGLQLVASFTVGLVTPHPTVAHLYELLKLRLERLQLSAPVDNLLLRAATTARLPQRQANLLDPSTDLSRERQLAIWLERLLSRLGEEAVARPCLQSDAQPELAWRREGSPEAGGRSRKAERRKRKGPSEFRMPNAEFFSSARPLQLEPLPRPIQVLAVVPDGPPIRFTWQGQDYRLKQVWGPERITTGWWRKATANRDYYRVETSRGQQFWLFRNRPDGMWFLHGEFG